MTEFQFFCIACGGDPVPAGKEVEFAGEYGTFLPRHDYKAACALAIKLIPRVNELSTTCKVIGEKGDRKIIVNGRESQFTPDKMSALLAEAVRCGATTVDEILGRTTVAA